MVKNRNVGEILVAFHPGRILEKIITGARVDLLLDRWRDSAHAALFVDFLDILPEFTRSGDSYSGGRVSSGSSSFPWFCWS